MVAHLLKTGNKRNFKKSAKLDHQTKSCAYFRRRKNWFAFVTGRERVCWPFCSRGVFVTAFQIVPDWRLVAVSRTKAVASGCQVRIIVLPERAAPRVGCPPRSAFWPAEMRAAPRVGCPPRSAFW